MTPQYYADALTLMVAAARAQGDIEAFVHMSNYEQSYMTLEKMTTPEEERRSWLGGLVTDWSPQQRAHWVCERVLDYMYGFAEDYAAVLGRQVVYIPEEVETWNEAFLDETVLQETLGDPAAARHVAAPVMRCRRGARSEGVPMAARLR